MTQTKSQIRSLLEGAGINPLKRFGQHFLIDANLMDKLVSAAEVRRDDVVLEVGPGTGALTELLLEQAGHVVAVEIDRGLHGICQSRFARAERLTLMHRDILETKSQVARDVIDTLVARQRELQGRILLVANLPYQVATPLLVDLLFADVDVPRMCFTVQAEVADRIIAPAGSKAYGPVSVFAQAMAEITRIAGVPPSAFWPVPKVDSSMLRVDVARALPPDVRREMHRLVHGCFNHRRKTMKSNLRTLVDDATLECIGQDGRWRLEDRPERVTVRQWIELANWLVEAAQ